MTAKELKSDMIASVNGSRFITLTELARFLGYSENSVKEVKRKYLKGLERIGKNYFIPDVVQKIMNEREIGE